MAEPTASGADLPSARAGRSRAVHVYDQLREMIHSRRIAPGTRVLEEDIARTMGVSRTPVREALSRLQARGLLTTMHGGLAVVELSRPQINELYAMRAVLEGSAARFAAENASASDLATLRHVAGLFERFEGDPDGFARVNTAFHDAMCEAAHNRYQVRMLGELNDYLSLLPSTTFAVTGRVPLAILEHARILDAIIARDPDAAEAAAREHINKALDARLALMFAFS